MVGDPARDNSSIYVRLDLSSRSGELQKVKLTPGEAPDDCVSAPIQSPPEIWDRCDEWYQHLEAMWNIRKADLQRWRKKNYQLASQMGELLRSALIPDALHRKLIEEMKCHQSKSLLIEICADDLKLDYLPLELLGQSDWGTEAQIVVWRCRDGSINRKPMLKLLAVRSAPEDVSLPQNENEIRAIKTYVTGQAGQTIDTEVLSDSTYDEFILKTHSFAPGVIHLAMHGTSKAFQFNSPPSNDPVGFGSLARYLGRQPSVTMVISTACFSARPTVHDEDSGVCFASELIEQGVPAAIGMASKITPRAAKEFTKHLYGELGGARPVAEAYARAVLAIRNMRDYDRLLWSVPVMYARSSNVIPFPDRGHLALLNRLQDMLAGIEDLRCQLARLPMMSQSHRIAKASGLRLDMASIRQDLCDLERTETSGMPTRLTWQKKLKAAHGQLNWLMDQVASSVSQGQGAEQFRSRLTVALDEVEELVADQFQIAVER